MGSWISSQGGMSEEERKRRQNLEELLHNMKYSLNVTASTHYLAAAHYRQLDTYLQYASYITGVLGTSGSFGSRLAWNVLATKSPRLALHCIVTKFIAYINLAKQENLLLNSLIIAKIDIHRDYNFVGTHRKSFEFAQNTKIAHPQNY